MISYLSHILEVMLGNENLELVDCAAAVVTSVLVIATSIWLIRRRNQKQNFVRVCRARGLSFVTKREAELKDRDGRPIGVRQVDIWQDPKFKVMRRKKRIIGIRVSVPPGVGQDRVEAARGDLGSVFGVDLLPPERFAKSHNTYTFSVASFPKDGSEEGSV